MADTRKMSKSELFTHFAERFGIKRAEAGEFFDELQLLAEQELLRCGEFVLPGVAKLVVWGEHWGQRIGRPRALLCRSHRGERCGGALPVNPIQQPQESTNDEYWEHKQEAPPNTIPANSSHPV